MSDPLRPFQRWFDSREIERTIESDTEQIEHRDRVAFAASLIRDHELRLWFERDWSVARQIAALCPECTVFSIEPGAMWLDELDRPPPWRRPGRRPPPT